MECRDLWQYWESPQFLDSLADKVEKDLLRLAMQCCGSQLFYYHYYIQMSYSHSALEMYFGPALGDENSKMQIAIL